MQTKIYDYAIDLLTEKLTEDQIPIRFKQSVLDASNDTQSLITYAREKKWEEMKAQRDYLETHQLDYNGLILDYDERSALKLEIASTGATGAIQNGIVDKDAFAIEWTLKDNSTAQLTYNDLMLIPLAAMDYSNKLHQHGRALRELINSTENLADILAINWNTIDNDILV